MDGTILIADDDRTIRTVLTQALTRAGCRVHATSSLTTLMRWIDEGRGDAVITDVVMPDGNGLELIPAISERRPGLPVIVISAQNTIMTAIQANEVEAFDYLPKPFDLPDLMRRVGVALKSQPTREPSSDTAAPGDALPLIGQAPTMQELYRLIARVLNSDLPVLIHGESGTGKSLIAKSMHELSDRRTSPLVVANAQDLALPGASAGVVARVGSGTLVLAQVQDADATAQSHLQRLSERSVRVCRSRQISRRPLLPDQRLCA
jgi:two-component system nitrogen regulation response regulator GlnG